MLDVHVREFIDYLLKNFDGKVTSVDVEIGNDNFDVYKTNDDIFKDELEVRLSNKENIKFTDTFIITPTNEEYHYLFSIRINNSLKFAIDIDVLLIRDFYLLEKRANFRYKGVEWEIKTETDVFKKILELSEKSEFFEKLNDLLEESKEYSVTKDELKKYLKEKIK